VEGPGGDVQILDRSAVGERGKSARSGVAGSGRSSNPGLSSWSALELSGQTPFLARANRIRFRCSFSGHSAPSMERDPPSRLINRVPPPSTAPPPALAALPRITGGAAPPLMVGLTPMSIDIAR
jgi:hypothetical protein